MMDDDTYDWDVYTDDDGDMDYHEYDIDQHQEDGMV